MAGGLAAAQAPQRSRWGLVAGERDGRVGAGGGSWADGVAASTGGPGPEASPAKKFEPALECRLQSTPADESQQKCLY